MTMTKITTKNKSGYVLAAAIFGSLLLTCCSSQSNNSSAAGKTEPQSTPAPQTAQASKPAQQDLFQELAEFAASDEFLTLTPDAVRQRLIKFAKLEDKASPEEKKENPGYVNLMGANPASGIQMIRVQYYQETEGENKGRFNMVAAEFALSRKEGDSDQIYNELKTLLDAQMKKHGEPVDGGGVTWDEGMILRITEDTNAYTGKSYPWKVVSLSTGNP
jgi:outer membrane murein-binding lipoprotein Lpp